MSTGQQVDWLSLTAGLLTDTPRARRTDPETSHAAAERIKVSGHLRKQQLEVLAALRQWPGSTGVELAKRSGLDRYLVSRRLPELVPIWVRRGRPRVCSEAGTPQTTWYPVQRNEERVAA